ncbi:MAG TPA: Crp/Fnr family transcriptional regulator [Xanthomonadaceae bacterium]|nr:Crp/Fnr family transcriptional regulator [Xanthomonadaceae bacterium]
MPDAAPPPVTNRLIDALPPRQRARLLRNCVPEHLHFGEVLAAPDQRIRDIHFPLVGFISLVVEVDGHPPLEAALIGNEGMLGATVLLGIDQVALRAVVQGSGSALRIDAPQLRRDLRSLPALRAALGRYLFVTLTQLAQTAACSRFHEAEPRLARWLLLVHDRAHADHFRLTHSYLAEMLGVQRSAVTIAAGALQRRRLIRYSRGEIRVLDRTGLEAASCECYRRTVDQYAQGFA